MPRIALHLFIAFSLVSQCARAQHHHEMELGGIADANHHPFADPAIGRDGYKLADELVNEFRVYDFYQREADHFMKQGAARFLPAYPGLDAGLHGHWGKHNQNNHSDDRWNQQLGNNLRGACLHVGKVKVHKGINLLLGDDGQLGACFDPWTMTWRYVWSGGFVSYNGYRWGTSRGVSFDGQQMLMHAGVWRNGNAPFDRMEDAHYHGLYRNGSQIALSYSIGRLEVLDSPWAISSGAVNAFVRRLAVKSADQAEHRLPLFDLPPEAKRAGDIEERFDDFSIAEYRLGQKCWLIATPAEVQVQAVRSKKRASVSVEVGLMGPVDRTLQVGVWHGVLSDRDEAISVLTENLDGLPPMSAFRSGGAPQWTETVTLPGELSDEDEPYVIDRLPVPDDNAYRSVMMLSGVDFLPNGDALVATLPGDIWKVSGIDDGLRNVTWKRYAAGLHQPFGIKIQGDDIFVLCKDRMQILRDLNHDGEADFYENYDNSWLEDKGHTHVFGTDRDREGNFYFPAYDLFYKLPADGSGVKLFAKGFRNCMGVAVSDDGLVLAAPQEGTWTPASMIIEVREGEHYGFQRSSEEISPPMCFVPRGVDNSTGGMVFVDSDRWGPLGKSLIGLSYGSGSFYQILRDESVPRPQGATVPLKGEFKSGVVRGRINPKDGQLYVVGTDGWGNYAISDGCLDRIRYTGKAIYQPSGFQVHENGIRIDFTEPLDPKTAADSSRYFAQQWNYEYSKGYGSVEFSVFRPHTIGHDRVAVRSVQVLNGGRSVFLEIPRIVPCYQMHIRMHLDAADGSAFKTDLFPTVLSLGDRFEFTGAAAPVPNREQKLRLQIKEQSAVVLKGHDPDLETSRTLTIKAIPGIQYDQTTLVAHAGESIELMLQNADGMPHNLVLVQPGGYEKVGRLSFKMLNDPSAFDRQYVPDVPEVITHTAVVFPKEKNSTKFIVPEEPGAYPYLCTFPGHWQSMRGQLIVVPADQPLPDASSLEQDMVALEGLLKKEDPATLAEAIRSEGDPREGAKLFYDARVSCANCHDPAEGPRNGPSLAERHEGTNDAYLIDSLLDPSKQIRRGYETIMVMTFDGRMRSGVMVSEDEDSISLRDLANNGELLKYRKEDLDDFMQAKTSSMPAGLVNNLKSRQQFLDLMSFVFAVSEGGEAKLNALR